MKNNKGKLILISILVIMLSMYGCAAKEKQKGSEVSPAVSGIAEKIEPSLDNNKKEVMWKTVYQDNLKFDFLKSGFMSEKVGIATGFGGENYFTNDGGKNWTLSKNESNNTNGFDMLKDNIVWYGDDFGDVGVSKDFGKTWNFGKNVFIVRVCCMSAIDSSTALVVSKDKLALTEDGGKSLTDIKMPEKMNMIAAAGLYSKNEGYLLDFNGKLYHSNDKFKTWDSSEIKGNSGAIQIRFEPGTSTSTAYLRCIDTNNIVIAYCDKDKGIYAMRSTDMGRSWVKETVTEENGQSVYVSHDGNYITYNSGLNTVNLLKYDKK